MAAKPDAARLSNADKWIIYETGEIERVVERALEEDRFSDAANALYPLCLERRV